MSASVSTHDSSLTSREGNESLILPAPPLTVQESLRSEPLPVPPVLTLHSHPGSPGLSSHTGPYLGLTPQKFHEKKFNNILKAHKWRMGPLMDFEYFYFLPLKGCVLKLR